MSTPTLDFGYQTLDQIVERINEADEFGMNGRTPEYIAAAYAVQEREGAGNDLCEESALEHFDELRVAGAEFDIIESLALLGLN